LNLTPTQRRRLLHGARSQLRGLLERHRRPIESLSEEPL
jgi:hypothetical protein